MTHETTTPKAQPILTIEHLKKKFGKQTVLSDISLSIAKGEIVCIIGQSGSGKSVILKHIIGLLIPDKGRILLDGVEISSPDKKPSDFIPIRKRLGMLFQGAALFDSRNVAENIAFSLREHSHLTETELSAIVDNGLEMVGLQPAFKTKMPSELSGGMKSRVGLARALVMKPEIMLYDEPTSALDPIMTEKINDLIVSLRDRLSMTSIVVTHDIASAYRIADRMIMIKDGHTIFSGTPAEIRASQNLYVREFILGQRKFMHVLSSTPRILQTGSGDTPNVQYLLEQRIFGTGDDACGGGDKKLLNSSSINEALNESIDRLHKRREPFTLVLCNIDKLSEVNKQFGAAAENKAIVEIGCKLYSIMRGSDKLAHIEYDEFMLILNNALPAHVSTAIDRMRRGIAEAILFQADGKDIRLTASFGAVVATTLYSNLPELIQAARLACSLAQQKGGNAVEIIDHPE
jgi:phospholipid/cholesterol/gamma-HCH transport system ATP-binding protein